MAARSTSPGPNYELKRRSDGTTDLVSATKLEPADFDAIRTALGAPLIIARKVGLVSARQATHEEHIETRWNGKETSAIARPGDWVITNMSPERTLLRDRDGSANTYVIRPETFARLYQRDEGQTEYGALYRSKSVVEAFLLSGGFEILAPWGEVQRGSRGYLLKNGDEVYGNHRDTFEATYEVVSSESQPADRP